MNKDIFNYRVGFHNLEDGLKLWVDEVTDGAVVNIFQKNYSADIFFSEWYKYKKLIGLEFYFT